MSSDEPIGDRKGRGSPLEDLERGRQRIEELVRLVPEELCVSFVLESWADMDRALEHGGGPDPEPEPSPAAVVAFAECILEEEDLDPAQAKAMLEFVDRIRASGKLPEPTPEQAEESKRHALAREVLRARYSFVWEWLDKYWTATRNKIGQAIPLDHDLFPAYLTERSRRRLRAKDEHVHDPDDGPLVVLGYRWYPANAKTILVQAEGNFHDLARLSGARTGASEENIKEFAQLMVRVLSPHLPSGWSVVVRVRRRVRFQEVVIESQGNGAS